jgi:hypothetical protein
VLDLVLDLQAGSGFGQQTLGSILGLDQCRNMSILTFTAYDITLKLLLWLQKDGVKLNSSKITINDKVFNEYRQLKTLGQVQFPKSNPWV